MPVLPTRDSLGSAPVPTPSNSVISADVTGYGRGAASFGADLARAGAVVAQGWNETDTRVADNKFQQFIFNEGLRLQKMVNETKPEDMRGIAGRWMESHKKAGAEFKSTLPADLQTEYDTRMLNWFSKTYFETLGLESKSQNAVVVNDFQNTFSNVYVPGLANELGDPKLSDYQRLAAKRKWEARLWEEVKNLPFDSESARYDFYNEKIAELQFYGSKGLPAESRMEMDPADWGRNKTQAIKDASKAFAIDFPVTEESIAAADAGLSAAGLDPSPENILLVHMLGPKEAVKVLQADPNTPVDKLLSKKSQEHWFRILGDTPENLGVGVDALPFITAGDIIGTAQKQMDGVRPVEWGKEFDRLTPEQEFNIAADGAKEVVAVNNTKRAEADAAYNQWFDGVLRGIMSGDVGLSDINANRNNFKSADDWNKALERYNKFTNDGLAYTQALNKWQNPGYQWDQYDSKDQKSVDTLFEKSTDPVGFSIEAVKRGMMPSKMASMIRTGLRSGDPKKVDAALQWAGAVMGVKPNIFAGVDGTKDINDNVLTFRHMVDDQGYSSEEANAKIVEMNTPGYQGSVSDTIKNQNIDKTIKDNLSVDDISKAFDTTPLNPFQSPAVGLNPKVQGEMWTTYVELWRENYNKNGDVGLSKTLALDQLKRTWGVTMVNGSETVMPYPPEKVFGVDGLGDYNGDINVSDAIADLAMTSIRQRYVLPSGVDGVALAGDVIDLSTAPEIDRSTLQFIPLPGVTAGSFKAGKPTPYFLWWMNADGTPGHLMPGEGFMVDPADIKRRMTEMRAEKFIEQTRGKPSITAPYQGPVPPVSETRPPFDLRPKEEELKKKMETIRNTPNPLERIRQGEPQPEIPRLR